MGYKSVRLSRKEERHAHHVEGNPRRPAQTPARCGRGRQDRQDGVSVRSAGYPGKDGSAKGPSTREGGSRSKGGGQGQTGCSQREGQKEMSNRPSGVEYTNRKAPVAPIKRGPTRG